MKKQGLTFDKSLANQARDEAIKAVEENASVPAKEQIYDVIVGMRGEFTTDDVWAEVPEDVRNSVEPRVIGALMRRAAKDGHVVNTYRMRNSEMVRCHRRPKQVWRSTTSRLL